VCLRPSSNHIDQLRLILETLGSPTEEQLGWMRGLDALRTLRALPPKRRVPWARLFPAANPDALDLLDRLLQFDPTRRITVAEALAHPYLADYADPADEPAAEPLPALDWAWDAKESVTRGELAGLMLAEMAHFRPGWGAAGPDAVRPRSGRMAALSTAAAAAATVAAANAAAAGGSTAPAAPVGGAGAAKQYASASAVAPGPYGPVAAPSAAPAPAIAVAAAAAAPPPAPPAAVGGATRSASDPGGLPPAHHAALSAAAPGAGAAAAAAVSGGGDSVHHQNAVASAAAHLGGGGAAGAALSSGSSALLLGALLGEMRGLRQDIISSVDRRLGEAETAMARRVEERVAAAVGPLASRLDRLERALGLYGAPGFLAASSASTSPTGSDHRHYSHHT